jgi:ligand-binding sensor domain-containing protein
MPVILLFCFLLIGVISPYSTVIAQELHFRNFTTKDGLPSVQVYNMYQDVNGFLWFATDRGICRYNGYAFETFGLKDGLTSNTVFKFYPQDNGDVWCSTLNNRFIIFNPIDYVFREYRYNDTLASYAADAINDDLFIDRNGTVHVGFINISGVLSIDSVGNCIGPEAGPMRDAYDIVLEQLPGGETFSYIQSAIHGKVVQREVLAQVKVSSTAPSYHKAAHRDSITLLSDQQQVYFLQNGQLQRIINNGARPLGVGFFDDGHIWISTQYGGVTIYDMQGKLVQHYLKGRSVTWLLADHEGGFWISTLSAGVFYTQSLQFRHAVLDSDPTIHNLTVDGEGRLIASLYNGNAYRHNEGAFELWYQSGDHKPAHIQFYDSLNTVLGYFDE